MTKTLPITISLDNLNSLLDQHDKKILRETKKIVLEITSQAADDILVGVDKLLQENYPKKEEVVLKKDFKKLYA